MSEPGGPGAEDRPPASPMAALAADTVHGLHGRLLALVSAGLGHLLRQQVWARERMRQHAGSVLQIRLETPASWGARETGRMPDWLPQPVFSFRVNDEGLLDPIPASVQADACLRLQPSVGTLSDLVRARDLDGLAREMRVEGDVRLAASLAELARHLRWDVEEDLSRVIGDVLAHRAGTLLREGMARLTQLPAMLGQAAQGLPGAADLRDGLGPLAPGHIWRNLRDESAALDARLHRLELRLQRRSAGLTG